MRPSTLTTPRILLPVVLALALAVAVVLAAPATTALAGTEAAARSGGAARTLSVTDPVGDVFVIRFHDHEEFKTNPRETRTDLTRVDFDYRRSTLVVTAHLRRVDARANETLLHVRGNGKNFRFLGKRGGKVELTKGGKPATTCTGASHTYQPGRDTITLRIPAQCFGAPGQARFNFATRRHADGPDASRDFSDALAPRGWSYSHFTSPVRRG